jgi:hypothetical protein
MGHALEDVSWPDVIRPNKSPSFDPDRMVDGADEGPSGEADPNHSSRRVDFVALNPLPPDTAPGPSGDKNFSALIDNIPNRHLSLAGQNTRRSLKAQHIVAAMTRCATTRAYHPLPPCCGSLD